MKKKMVAAVLSMAMVMGLMTGCGSSSGGSSSSATSVSGETEEVVINGITYNKATDLTSDKITLTYFNFDQDEITQYLAERFMELYPNITVNVTYENVATYDDTLLTLVSNGQTPDVIMYSDADFALSNMLLQDISAYWNSDPETAKVASTINDAGIGCFGTSARYAVPVKFFPGIMYIDRNVLETLNVDVPDQDWTWDEMIQLIKDCTVKDSPDGMAYYGVGVYNRLDSYYGIASSQDIVGEFGFDGTDFDLSAWAVGEQEFADLAVGGYRAPSTETQEMEDWAGDWEAWCGTTGHVALFTEAFWTYQGTWATPAYEQYGLDIVPYVVPAVSADDASADHHSIATIDFGGVTTSCKYPREAYELLKFMSFGVDGWKTRIEAYNNEELTNASGLALKYDVMPAPITTDEEVWDAYIDMYCAGMDEEHKALWENYFASCMQPIPYGWTSIAGYWNYCDGYFNSIGIHTLVDNGTAKAADYVDEATKKANWYHATAMLQYFGESGYNVLTDEEVALYEQMVTDNQ
ncbi:MAG: carbohydrate ABC transporter substrate-binding protein [Butyrivibrio sp.]|jgi:multiple sugar transport system substrate-binding protein|nr:carbohydrate ABC transporter substrate-binding protein [Butyrivibrio sp.]